jgi:ATP-dependent DNA helicase RecG
VSQKSYKICAKAIAQTTGQKASYSKNKAFDKQYYLDLICKAIQENKSLNRKDIDDLLWNKLPEWMSDNQRKNKVGNLLGELKERIILKILAQSKNLCGFS